MHSSAFCLLILSATAIACTTANADSFSLSGSQDFYYCEDPNPPVDCHVSSEEKQATCPECNRWAAGFYQIQAQLDLPADAYSYDTAPFGPRASTFMKDATTELFGEGAWPRTGTRAVLVREIYENPSSFGFVEIEDGAEVPGAIALWPNLGGIVLETESDEVRVLYPSDAMRGALRTLPIERLASAGEPRFVLPESVIREGLSEQSPD